MQIHRNIKHYMRTPNKRTIKLIFLGVLGTLFVMFVTLNILFRPSHDRNWELGQEELPHIICSDNGKFTIENFRNFNWNEDGTSDINYENKFYDINTLDSVDVYISHFDDFEGLAHIFLSFGFQNGEHVAISLETRREVDEEFSPVLGILRQFEIIYVVSSEKDIVGLRTDIRNERVYLYPTRASSKQAQDLFRLISKDVNSVYESPRIYNTLTHNCTNELTRRTEEVSGIDFPLTWKSVLPGIFDEVLYELNIIDNDVPFEEVKKRHFIQNQLVDKNNVTFEQDLRSSVSNK